VVGSDWVSDVRSVVGSVLKIGVDDFRQGSQYQTDHPFSVELPSSYIFLGKVKNGESAFASTVQLS
jgi:hypothetical protein